MNDADSALGLDYKRTLDMWIKVIAIATPLVAIAVAWGFQKASMNAIDRKVDANMVELNRRLANLEARQSMQESYNVSKVQTDARNSEQLTQMNSRMGRIEVILDARLRK